jgi:hypothetical protein
MERGPSDKLQQYATRFVKCYIPIPLVATFTDVIEKKTHHKVQMGKELVDQTQELV